MLPPRRDRLVSLRSNADSQRETQPGCDGRASDSQQNSIEGPPVPLQPTGMARQAAGGRRQAAGGRVAAN